VIWSKGPDQPAELGSPTAVGTFRDTNRLDRFGAGLAPQPQRFDLPKFRDNFLGAASLFCHSHQLLNDLAKRQALQERPDQAGLPD
jgi:hypothetical protein